MDYKVYSYADGETEWVAATSRESAIECLRDNDNEDPELESKLEELTTEELAKLTIRIEDGDIMAGKEDTYGSAKEFLDKELAGGQPLPYLFMSTYF